MPAFQLRKQLAGLVVLLGAMAGGAQAAAADLVDPATGTRFESEPTVDGTAFHCLGAGVRKVALFNAYSVAYCVDAQQADTVDDLIKLVYPDRAGKALERTLERDQHFFDALSEVPGDKLVILHFVRDLSKSALADAFRSSLQGQLPKDKIDSLVGAIPDGARGDTALLYTHGNQVVISMGASTRSIDDEAIASHLWDVWLGPRSATPSLKSSIAREAAADSNPVTASR